ncbi:MAG TPA: hypothetical protein VKB57_11040, partial [Acidimicrobiales bacterium]|nr:hypothetical protein [Acidimicrobiales bacterium]
MALVGAMARSDPTPPSRVDLRDGAAWVASSRVGMMTLIDGETAEVVARVDVGAGTGSLQSAQAGTVGYAVDAQRGTVVRVDPRTFASGRPARVVPASSGHVAARATGRALYLFDEAEGKVVVADPRDLAVHAGDDASLADSIGSGVVDATGRLWLLGATTGDLVWFDGRARHTRPSVVERPHGAELVAAGGHPVLVDRAGRRVHRIGRSGGLGAGACVDMRRGDDTVRFGGASDQDRVYSVSGAQGVLRVSDLDGGGCTDVAISVAERGSDLGDPVEVDGHVFVPNYTTGTVAVVDLAHRRSHDTDRPVAHGTFELFSEDGFVFYNDPDTEQAGVIRLDGTFKAVAKYNPADPGDGVDNAPDGPAPAHRAPRRAPRTPATTQVPRQGPGTTGAPPPAPGVTPPPRGPAPRGPIPTGPPP